MAVTNSYMFTVVRINSITISHHSVIQNPHTCNINLFTANQMCCPESALSDCHIFYRKMSTVFHKNHRYSWIKCAIYLVFPDFSIIYLLRTIYYSTAAYTYTIGILCIYEILSWLAIIFTINKCRDFNFMIMSDFCNLTYIFIIVHILTGF